MLGSKPTKPMIYGWMLLKRHRRGCMAPFVCEIEPGLGGACGRWEEVEEVSMLNHLLCASCTCLCCTVLSMPGSFIVRICPISRPAILLPVYLGQYYITAPQACSNIKERVGCSFHIVQNSRQNLVQTRFCGDSEFGSNTTEN